MNAPSSGTRPQDSTLWTGFLFSVGVHLVALLGLLLFPSLGHKPYPRPSVSPTLMVSLVGNLASSEKEGRKDAFLPLPPQAHAPPAKLAKPLPLPMSVQKPATRVSRRETTTPPEPPRKPTLKESTHSLPSVSGSAESFRKEAGSPSPTVVTPFKLPPLPSIAPVGEAKKGSPDGMADGVESRAGTMGAIAGHEGSGKVGSEKGMVGAGGGLPGIFVDNPDFQFAYYLVIIQNKVGSNWVPPSGTSGLAEKEKKRVVIGFRILRNGEIREVRVEESSGAKPLDQSALRAISRSNPLPPLPPRFLEESLGVHFSFELEGEKG